MKAQARGTHLVSLDDLPDWAVDNEWIISGYRAPGGINAKVNKARTGSVDAKEQTRLRRRNGHPKGANGQEDDHAVFYEHNTVSRCWWSLWLYIHNETVNIHTHFWGALLVLAAIAFHLLSVKDLLPSFLYPLTHHSIFYPQAIIPAPASPFKSSWSHFLFGGKVPTHQRPNTWQDIIGFACYLVGALTVLTFSATFHAVVCHSRELSHTCNKFDYIGIVAMIVGSFIPMLHYGFYCHPYLQLFYSASIVSLGGLATYTVVSSKFTTPAYRSIRTNVFLALGLSAVIPVAHICAMYGYEAVSRTMGVDWIITGGVLYVVGALLYMARVPERFSPGTFDNFGASHQIFHVLILLAAASHYVCIRRSYSFWHTAEVTSGEAICQTFESLRFGHQ
ncbi:hypothetical protein CBS101457_003556 [Exobasidium rhododendri]|nr:hypothetical protein CBS101457_003556 [Exobasidium rhododendri]